MFFVVEFVVDKTLEVIRDGQSIFDGEPFVGQTINVMWKSRNKTKEFEAIILFISASHEEAEAHLATLLSGNSTKDIDSPMGKRSRRQDTDGEENEEKKRKTKECSSKLVSKELKTQEGLAKTAKEIFRQIQKPSENLNESEKLIEENRRLRRENERLKKDLQTSQDINKWLTKLKNLTKTLQMPCETCKARPVTTTNPDEEVYQDINRDLIVPDVPTETQETTEVQVEPIPEPLQDQAEEDEAGSSASLLFKHPKKTNQVEELAPGSGVFIEKGVLQSMRIAPKSHSMIARNLLLAIFTNEALSTCSLKGKMSSLSSPDNRKGLPPHGVKAIFDVSRELAAQSNLKVESDKDIVKHLGTKLSELRKKVSK